MAMEDIVSRGGEYLRQSVVGWTDEFVCKVLQARQANAPVYLLSGIYLKVCELVNAMGFGNNFYRITPVSLTAGGEPEPICDVQSQGRVRKISIWVDIATGGPLPIIRISTGASGSSSGGLRIAPGTVSELGEVPANTRLYVASSQDVTMYVIERG